MIFRILALVALLAGSAFSDVKTTQPSTRPAKPAKALAARQPTTQPTTSSAFPSLRDTIAKLKETKKAEQELLKVAYIDLDKPVSEKPAAFVIFTDQSMTLQSILARLDAAEKQKDLRAVLINIGQTDLNLAQAQEVRDALRALNRAGKRTFVYADAYDTPAYVAATGASDICILEGGEIEIPGVGVQPLFAKGLLDKVGVKADYIQIGQYKGADEMYTRSEPSAELKGELDRLVDSLFSQIVDGISYHRNLPRSQVEDMINGVMISGRIAKNRGFVDHLVDQDGLRALLKNELGRDINLIHDYGLPKRDEMDFSNPFAFLSALTRKPAETHDKPAIALIYLDGVIVDGEGGDGILTDGGAGSEDLRKALRVAARDEDVQAVVLRIDSPGGSALASEVIWQAARRLAMDKPLIISVGSMAASGGYYVASAGDYIFADPTAIVGSIGVVGGKFVMKDLFDKIGLNTATFSRGQNADLFSSTKPFTDSQRRLITNWMKQTYEQFTDRILTTRKHHIKDIDQVAHGRIFAARQAKDLGLVDEIGGLKKAIAHAADQADLDDGDYIIKVIPPTRTLADLLTGEGMDARLPFQPSYQISPNSVLHTLSPHLGRLVRQQIQLLQLLQERPVMLVSPYRITLK